MGEQRTDDPPDLRLVSAPRPNRAHIVLALKPYSDAWFLLEHAVDWATRLDATLHIRSVVEPVNNGWGLTARQRRQQKRGLREARRWLARLFESIPPRLRGGHRVVEGDPVLHLMDSVENVCLLVIGRSAERFGRAIARSSGAEIARGAAVPVLVAGGRRLRRAAVVQLPFDPEQPRFEAARWVFRHLPHARVSAVHAVTGAAPLASGVI